MEIEIVKKLAAQEEYCNENGKPLFIPSDGQCFFCGRQIMTHIPLETCKTQVITSCPYPKCHRSYSE